MFLVSVEELLVSILSNAGWRSVLSFERKEEVVEEHKTIVHALEQKDVSLAHEIMLKHLTNAENWLGGKKHIKM